MALGALSRIHPLRRTDPALAADASVTPGVLTLRLGVAGPFVIIGAHVVYGFMGSVIYSIPAL
ncbi:MAG: hypothetical protein FJ318_10150 [SAR202 cluster bacterium]|nr:hypothetical protein [SAR202 cluster bacterium]